MAFHYGTSPASGSYREILTRLAAFATSKHVSAAAVNNDGSGYTVGDLLTISHASDYGDCIIEVLTVGGGGEILTVAIRSAGAFARRLGSAVVNAGGTGYAVGNILEISGGTATEKAKVRVATIAGSAVATVTVFETGGAYSADPTTTGCATSNEPGLGTGTGCTLDLTMQAIIGTTGIAATGGTGASATFDLTLTATGWTSLRNRNSFTTNSITDEKEVILQGTAGGGNDPIVGFQTYTQTSGLDTRYGWLLVGMDTFNSGLSLASQVGVGPSTTISATGGIVLLMFDDDQDYWFRVNGRNMVATVKAVGASTTTYQTGVLGLMSPFGTTSEAPYPMYVSGSTRAANTAPDAAGFSVSGPTEVFAASASVAPAAFRRPSDGAYVAVLNSNNGSVTTVLGVVLPIGVASEATGLSTSEDYLARVGGFGFTGGVSLVSGAVATVSLMPTIGDDETELYPATVCSYPNSAADNDSETTVRGEIDGIYWISATKADGSALVAEDTITVGSTRYKIFQNAHRTERYSYFALAEN